MEVWTLLVGGDLIVLGAGGGGVGFGERQLGQAHADFVNLIGGAVFLYCVGEELDCAVEVAAFGEHFGQLAAGVDGKRRLCAGGDDGLIFLFGDGFVGLSRNGIDRDVGGFERR